MLPPRNVNVMPWTIVALVAHIIGPCGRVHHQIHRRAAAPALELRIYGIVGEDFLYHLPRCRREVFFRDQSHRLMALAAPGIGGRSRHGQQRQCACQHKSFGIHSISLNGSSPTMRWNYCRKDRCSPGAERFQALSQRPMGFHDSV
jgi:hypothetical protein